MKKFVFALFVLPLLIACASTSKAPADKSEAAKRFEKHPEKAVVYLYRTGRMVGAAGQIQVKINGIEAGGTGPGTFFRWELKPGSYSFMSSTAESSRVVELNVKAGEHYFLRQDARVGVSAGRVTLVEKDEATGMKEIDGCQLIVSAYKQE
jgi:outer membrane biogenesis lipoprotein LolB